MIFALEFQSKKENTSYIPEATEVSLAKRQFEDETSRHLDDTVQRNALGHITIRHHRKTRIIQFKKPHHFYTIDMQLLIQVELRDPEWSRV